MEVMFRTILITYFIIGLKVEISLSQNNRQSLVTTLQNDFTTLQDSKDEARKPIIVSKSNLNGKIDSSQTETGKLGIIDLNGEWKTVSEEDVLPAEASVKVHLGTGQKMARIDESGKKYLVFDQDAPFTLGELKKGLKSVKKSSRKQEKRSEVNRIDYRDEKLVLEELKQYGFQNVAVSQVLSKFLDNYTKSDTAGKIAVLNEVEFLVHQYTVAHDFVSLRGVDLVLTDIHCENESLQAMIAITLGSAMQGNPLVQSAVFERNVMPIFLKFLKSKDSVLQSRAMFALSALLHQHPKAQAAFISHGGLEELSHLFTGDEAPEKIRKKIITLVSDLTVERQIIEENVQRLNSSIEADVALRERMLLEKLMKNYGFCSHIISLLSTEKHDVRETVILAMSRFKHVCKEEFRTVIKKLKHLEHLYKVEAYLELLSETAEGGTISEVPELYFNDLYNSLSDIILELELHPKDEL